MRCVVKPKTGPLSIIPLVRKKREAEAQAEHNRMTWMTPGSAAMGENLILNSVNDVNGGPCTVVSRVINQWQTEPAYRQRPRRASTYVKIKRKGTTLAIDLDIQRAKLDLRNVKKLVRDYRKQKILIRDMQLFL